MRFEFPCAVVGKCCTTNGDEFARNDLSCANYDTLRTKHKRSRQSLLKHPATVASQNVRLLQEMFST